MPIAAALESAHYPDDFARRDAALRRLGFDELLALQIGMVARDRQRRVAVGEPVAVPRGAHPRVDRRGGGRADRAGPRSNWAAPSRPA